jgi:hypothetical protein
MSPDEILPTHRGPPVVRAPNGQVELKDSNQVRARRCQGCLRNVLSEVSPVRTDTDQLCDRQNLTENQHPRLGFEPTRKVGNLTQKTWPSSTLSPHLCGGWSSEESSELSCRPRLRIFRGTLRALCSRYCLSPQPKRGCQLQRVGSLSGWT